MDFNNQHGVELLAIVQGQIRTNLKDKPLITISPQYKWPSENVRKNVSLKSLIIHEENSKEINIKNQYLEIRGRLQPNFANFVKPR